MAAKPYEAALQRSIDLWQSGEASAAIEQLKVLASEHPNEGAIRGLLGCYYYDADAPHKAMPHLRAAVRISPKSELAARALFHTYYDLGELKQARLELRRFLVHTKSEEKRREWSQLLEDLEAEMQAQ